MAKTTTFKSLAAVLLLSLGFQVSFAQPAFWTETFDSPTDAVHGGINAGAQVWTWTTDPLAGFVNAAVPPFGAPTASTGYFLFNSDANGQGFAHDVTLTGVNPANCTGKSDVHLRFSTQYFYENQNDISVGVSTDGVLFSYTPILDALPALAILDGVIDIDLDAADGQSQVWIQFRFGGTWQYHWKVDDLELYEFAAPIHDVTFKVDASLLTVDPGGMRLAGSFNGWTDQLMNNDGGGIWSATVPFEEGSTHQYKFKNGPNGWESVQPACGVPDGFGGFNRGLTVGSEDVILPAVCFNSCNACVVPCALNPNSIICDDFETYTVGNISPQSPHWIPWNLVDSPTNIISAEVSTDFASNGTKSMKVRQDGTAGDDQLLQLGDKSTGRYELKWKYYIPAGRATYFNIQTTEIVPQPAPPSANFATEVYFRATGIVDQVSPTPIVSGTFPFDTWFPVKLIVDLDNNLAKLFVNGNLIRGWVYTGDFGAIDFYAADATYLAYVDEVEYIQLPALVYNVDVCDAAVDLTLFFGQATPQTTGIYDNTNATVAATDPTVDCWNEADPGEDILNNTMWYTFVGDGKKYHIETVPCNATNYITGPGDTQMLVYAGDDCANLTEIVCNDDLSFAQFQDWRAGVDIETDPGQTYYMLIDGFDNVGTVSVGEFCIEISVLASVLCADAVMGTYEVSSPFLCEGAQLADLVTIDPGTFTIPNEGLVSGLVWAITTSPVNPAIFPTQANGLVGSTGYMADPFVLGHVNDGTPFAFNVYYITPILVGSGVDTDPLNGPSLFDTDPSGGCFFIGASTQVVFLPLTDDITVTAVAGASSVNATAIGGIAGITLDPSSYTYLWSNGATTEDLTGVPLGTYTVTVSDECSFEGTASAVVTIVGTKDPASIQSLVVSPNPTVGIVTLNLALATAAEVRIEVLNTLGQTLQTLNAGKLSNLSQKVDLNSMAQGSYFLRVTVDGETAIRRVLVQR